MFNNKNKDSINDFGKQFKYHNKIDDYWGSQEILKDIVNPFNLSSVRDKIICEIGVGSGRILKNLIKFYPKKIYAIEPSESIEVAKKNTETIMPGYTHLQIAQPVSLAHHLMAYVEMIGRDRDRLNDCSKDILISPKNGMQTCSKKRLLLVQAPNIQVQTPNILVQTPNILVQTPKTHLNTHEYSAKYTQMHLICNTFI